MEVSTRRKRGPHRRRTGLAAVCLAALGLLASPGPAHAADRCPPQPSDSIRALALSKRWHQKAVRHYSAQRYALAIEAWQCSHSLFNRAATLYNIAQAAEDSKRWALALKYYLRYLDKRPDAPNRAQVAAKIARLREKVPASQQPRARQVGEGGGATGGAATEPKPGGPSPHLRNGGWASLGIGLALAVVAAGLGGAAMAAKRRVEGASDGTPWSDLIGSYESYPGLRTGFYVTLGLAAPAVIVGVALLLADRARRRSSGDERPKTASGRAGAVQLSPVVRPGGGGLVIGGRF